MVCMLVNMTSRSRQRHLHVTVYDFFLEARNVKLTNFFDVNKYNCHCDIFHKVCLVNQICLVSTDHNGYEILSLMHSSMIFLHHRFLNELE